LVYAAPLWRSNSAIKELCKVYFALCLILKILSGAIPLQNYL
jgi:hypothetical protein